MSKSIIISPDNLPEKIPIKHASIMNLEGKEFNRLKVLYYVGSTKQGPNWLCQCECGNYIIIPRQSLTRKDKPTKSCGCYSREVASKTHRKDLTNKKFNLLTALYPVGADKDGHVRWHCQCECGKTTSVNSINLQSGGTKSCGCLGRSTGEYNIEQFLIDNEISYRREYVFNDLFSHKGYLLRFDFAIFNKQRELICLIEYQGIHHFKNIYGLSDEEWVNSQIRDQMKRDYCINRNIKLYEILYSENLSSKMGEIANEININCR